VRPAAAKNTVGFNVSVWAFSMSAAYMLGSVLGGALGPERWKEVHIVSGAVALLALGYMGWQDEPPRADSKARPEGLEVFVRQPEVLALLLNNLALGIIFTGGLVATSLFMMNRLAATPVQVATFFILNSGLHGLANFLVLPYCIKRFHGPWQAMTGSILLALASAMCLLFDFAYSTLVGFCALMFTSSLILPICMTSANIACGAYAAKYTKNARTVALALSRFCFNVGQILGPVLAVVLLRWHRAAQFAGTTLFTVATWAAWFYVHHRVADAAAAAEKGNGEKENEGEGGAVELTTLVGAAEAPAADRI